MDPEQRGAGGVVVSGRGGRFEANGYRAMRWAAAVLAVLVSGSAWAGTRMVRDVPLDCYDSQRTTWATAEDIGACAALVRSGDWNPVLPVGTPPSQSRLHPVASPPEVR